MPEPLIDAVAAEFYQRLLHGGGRLRVDEIRLEQEGAVARLVEIGLLVLRTADGTYSAVNPRMVGERIGTELREEGARLINRAGRVPRLLDDLTQAYDAAPRRHPKPFSGVEYVAGMPQIQHRIEQLLIDHPHEAFSMQPGYRPPANMDDGFSANRRYRERGGTIRTIYDESALRDSETILFASRCTELGAVYRVLPGPFTRMMVFGRKVAVVPASSDNTTAAFIDDPAVVAFLSRAFDLHWQQAEGVNWAALAAGSVEPAHEQVSTLLARGLTHKAVATRLGLSERTVAGHIARLRELYDAETLFQLGWQMQRTERDAAS
ncbi:LuxR family transcriptional regulator [Kitasatospora sp. NPDC051170]|uniref:LuxR family transcriptional regulator n=1 Tax=Kitasatospora sp. NPDC051170 TaxID=3364056 RepID=UPI0037A09D70